MKGTRRSVYFKGSELELLDFIELKEGNFSFVIKEMIQQAKENDTYLADSMRLLISEIAEVKSELQNLKQQPIHVAPPLPNEINDGNETEFMQEDERDYSCFDDL